MTKHRIVVADIQERIATEGRYHTLERVRFFERINGNLSDLEQCLLWFCFIETERLHCLNTYMKIDFKVKDYRAILSLLDKGVIKVFQGVQPDHPRAMVEINLEFECVPR